MRVFVVRGFPVAVSLLHYDCYDWTLFMMGNGGRLGLDFSIPSLHSGFWSAFYLMDLSTGGGRCLVCFILAVNFLTLRF